MLSTIDKEKTSLKVIDEVPTAAIVVMITGSGSQVTTTDSQMEAEISQALMQGHYTQIPHWSKGK